MTTSVAPHPPIADQFTDRRRITEDHPTMTRLHVKTALRLQRSIRELVRDLHATPANGDTAPILSRFISRHVGILRAAYTEAHAYGQRHYYQAVSAKPRTPRQWLAAPDQAQMNKRLSFYAPSVAKMAHEALQAWRDSHAAKAKQSAIKARTLSDSAIRFDDAPVDPLDDWADGLGARVQLQADVMWPGEQDGYVAGGVNDPANPYNELWWDLEPAAQHCTECPSVAAGSPYDAPGSGGNELLQTPGDGATSCGAACKCSLEYRYGGGPLFYNVSDFFPDGMPQVQDGEPIQPAPPYTQQQQAHEYYQRLFPNNPPDEAPVTPSVDTTAPTTQAQQSADYFARMFPNQAQEAAIDEGLTDAQKQALDSFRAQWLQWNYYREMFPQAPNLFAFDVDVDQLPSWDQLTPKQQEILGDMYQAIEDWNAASADAAGLDAGDVIDSNDEG